MTDKRKVIIGVGINHRTAPVEERECMAFSEAEMNVSLAALRWKLGGGVILSTCNRTELYATADDDDQLGDRLIDHLISAKGIEAPINRSHFYVVRNEAGGSPSLSCSNRPRFHDCRRSSDLGPDPRRPRRRRSSQQPEWGSLAPLPYLDRRWQASPQADQDRLLRTIGKLYRSHLGQGNILGDWGTEQC